MLPTPCATCKKIVKPFDPKSLAEFRVEDDGKGGRKLVSTGRVWCSDACRDAQLAPNQIDVR